MRNYRFFLYFKYWKEENDEETESEQMVLKSIDAERAEYLKKLEKEKTREEEHIKVDNLLE